jgi:hypothetical protein
VLPNVLSCYLIILWSNFNNFFFKFDLIMLLQVRKLDFRLFMKVSLFDKLYRTYKIRFIQLLSKFHLFVTGINDLYLIILIFLWLLYLLRFLCLVILLINLFNKGINNLNLILLIFLWLLYLFRFL